MQSAYGLVIVVFALSGLVLIIISNPQAPAEKSHVRILTEPLSIENFSITCLLCIPMAAGHIK